jgi:hypothetical protein
MENLDGGREGMHVHIEGVKLITLQGNGRRKLRWMLWIMRISIVVLTLQSCAVCNTQTFNSSHAATIQM